MTTSSTVHPPGLKSRRKSEIESILFVKRVHYLRNSNMGLFCYYFLKELPHFTQNRLVSNYRVSSKMSLILLTVALLALGSAQRYGQGRGKWVMVLGFYLRRPHFIEGVSKEERNCPHSTAIT
jgi:hypothetical protein